MSTATILSQADLALKNSSYPALRRLSVEGEENEAVVASFLEETSAFRQVSLCVPERLLSADGAARTWPQRDSTDGFFIAAFERRS